LNYFCFGLKYSVGSVHPTFFNFAITNLPTGQLAKATITGYDTNGRPKTATINIDDDANGVGWFVDSTPGDSSEFRGGMNDPLTYSWNFGDNTPAVVEQSVNHTSIDRDNYDDKYLYCAT
jgi:hypothetical protein